MRKLSLAAFLLTALFITACNQSSTQEETKEGKSEKDSLKSASTVTSEDDKKENAEMMSEKSDSSSKHFGELIEAEGAMSMADFSKQMEGEDTLNVKIEAVASEVCQKKGCWMKVKTTDGESMRIRFKDYGFFVPKDISGKTVVFEGIAFRDTISVEDLRHFAEDEGQSADEIAAITEPEIKTSFLANGVLIK